MSGSISTLPPPAPTPIRIFLIDADPFMTKKMRELCEMFKEPTRYHVIGEATGIPAVRPFQQVQIVIFTPDDFRSALDIARLQSLFTEKPWFIAQTDLWNDPVQRSLLYRQSIALGFARGNFRRMLDYLRMFDSYLADSK